MKETITVLARAIPEKSGEYGLTACVAGLNEQDEWRRLYPYPLDKIRFQKRDKITAESESNPQDVRKESRKVNGPTQVVGQATPLETASRLEPLVTSIAGLEASKSTLGVVKPVLIDARIIVNSTELPDAQAYLSAVAEEGFGQLAEMRLPVQVNYVFRCRDPACRCARKPHDIPVIDWEVNELALQVMRTETDRTVIVRKMREELYGLMKAREFYLIMAKHSRWGTWLIVGLFHPDSDEGKAAAAQET